MSDPNLVKSFGQPSERIHVSFDLSALLYEWHCSYGNCSLDHHQCSNFSIDWRYNHRRGCYRVGWRAHDGAMGPDKSQRTHSPGLP